MFGQWTVPPNGPVFLTSPVKGITMNDVDLQWLKSSFCGDSACLEVADVGGGLVAVRDSKNPLAYLTFTKVCWNNFVESIESGELTLA
jgi:hypothetical protein